MRRHDQIEQGTDAWHQKRKGVISGTQLQNVMGTPKSYQNALYEVVSERLTYGIVDDENAMERGLRLEGEAIRAFEAETGETVERTGFCESEENASIGYSPDGLIGETKDVEIKCMGGRNHVKMWLTNKVPEEYYWQVIQAFIVNPKLEMRYFVGYNPDIPRHPLHIIEVHRKDVEADIHNAEVKQKQFLKEVEKLLEPIIKD